MNDFNCAFDCEDLDRDEPELVFFVVFFLLYVLRAIFIPPL